jgi:hypothetical protein
MNRLAHLVATDVRRFRLIIAASLAVSVAVATIEVIRPLAAAHPRAFVAASLTATLIWVANVLITIVLVPSVVQAHPLVGSDAFWLTRPIDPRTLLASKIALLSILLIGVPVLCELVSMILYVVPAGQMGRVAVQSALFQALIMIGLMVPASVTRNLGGFAMLCGSAVMALALAIALAGILAASRIDEDYSGALVVGFGSPALASEIDDSTEAVLVTALAIAAGLAILLVQYRTRLRSRSLPTGAAAVALAWVLLEAWPWPVLRPHITVPDWSSAPGSLRLSADPSSVKFEGDLYWAGAERRWRRASAHVKLAGLAPAWRAMVRVESASLDLGDRGRLTARGLGYAGIVALDAPDELQEREVIRDLLGVTRVGGFNRTHAEDVVLFVVREAEYVRHIGSAGAYTGTFFVDLSRDEIASVLPLRSGASYQHDADRFVIDDVKYASGISVRMRRSAARTMFDRRVPPVYSYYLRNPRRREATTTSVQSLLRNSFGGAVSGRHVSVSSDWTGFSVEEERIFTQAASAETPPYAVPIDAAWLAEAELVIVRNTRAGSVVRTLEIRGFPVAAPQPQ